MVKKIVRRVLLAMNLPPDSQLYDYSLHICQQLSEDGTIVLTDPTLQDFKAHIDEYGVAEAAVLSKKVGAAEERDLAKETLLTDLRSIAGQVQKIANKTQAKAASIIKSAGFDVKNSSKKEKPSFIAKHGKPTGVVRLIAKASKKRSFHVWQYSFDGVTWIDLPGTTNCSTIMEGLKPGTIVYFRHKIIFSDTEEPWSHIEMITVN